MPGVLDMFGLETSPDHTSFWNWAKEFLDTEVAQPAPRNCGASGYLGPPAIDASGFQRDQLSHHYRKRANYSFQKMKPTLLVATKTVIYAWFLVVASVLPNVLHERPYAGLGKWLKRLICLLSP